MQLDYGTKGPHTPSWVNAGKLLAASVLLAAALYLVYTNGYQKGYLDGALHERVRLAPHPVPLGELVNPRPNAN